MQFVRGGPDIPERLLYAHEQGRVVFFCGAGVSKPAGIPLFGELAEQLYGAIRGLPETPPAAWEQAIKERRLDKALGVLKAEAAEGVVDAELQRILVPDDIDDSQLATHRALLELGRGPEQFRLITTNVDRLFIQAGDSPSLEYLPARESYIVPHVPPSGVEWGGLVYLHGLLGPSSGNLKGGRAQGRAVFSSEELSVAYYKDDKISGFLREIFRRYTVCFVGYSMDGPIRNIVEAFKEDRRQGEAPEVFAFCPDTKAETQDWKDSGVTLVPYSLFAWTDDEHKHTPLHQTLAEWGNTYSSDLEGKKKLVSESVKKADLSDEADKEFREGQLLWALGDRTGKPARHFANLNPVPPLGWLDSFKKARYGVEDAERFGFGVSGTSSKKLAFSLLSRPFPSGQAPRMSLSSEKPDGYGNVDEIMTALAYWLTRHLNDPTLASFLIDEGGDLEGYMKRDLRWQLNRIRDLEEEGNTKALDLIRKDAPNAIPSPAMRTVWDLMLAGLLAKQPFSSHASYDWEYNFKRHGLTPGLRLRLRELLSPRISLGGPIPGAEPQGAERVTDLFHCNVDISAEGIHGWLKDLRGRTSWQKALPELLDDFERLLLEHLYLVEKLGLLDDHARFFVLRQIDLHEERGRDSYDRHDWTALIELVRDAWLAIAESAPDVARERAEVWQGSPYLEFRRLAYFAAAQKGVVPPRQGLEWLLADDNRWFWAITADPEAIRLMVTLAPGLEDAELQMVEEAVLSHLSSADEGDDEETIASLEWAVGWRLKQLEESVGKLGSEAAEKFKEIADRYPRLENPRDMRPRVTGPQELPKAEEELDLEGTVAWLRRNSAPVGPLSDDWQDRCRKYPAETASALCQLAGEGEWPTFRWISAFRAWKNEEAREVAWQQAADAVATAPESDFRKWLEAGDVSKWLEQAATVGVHSDHFLSIARRILRLDKGQPPQPKGMISQPGEEGLVPHDDPVYLAINNPVGHAATALIRWYLRLTETGENASLLGEVETLMTELCDTEAVGFQHARVLLASRAVHLFYHAPDWTRQHLLPLFDWKVTGAANAWAGFLWLSGPSEAFMEALKEPFLDAVDHYSALAFHGYHPDSYQEAYTALMVAVSLDLPDIYSKEELARVTSRLPADGLAKASEALYLRMHRASEPAEEWELRIKPYLQSIWPQTKVGSPHKERIADNFGALCIAAGEKFRDAVTFEAVRQRLGPEGGHRHLLSALGDSDLCEMFPSEALAFLSIVVGDDAGWSKYELGECLQVIAEAEPNLVKDGRYKALTRLA